MPVPERLSVPDWPTDAELAADRKRSESLGEKPSIDAVPLRAVLPVPNWRGGKMPTVKEMREERKRQALTEGRHFGDRTKMCLTGCSRLG